MAEECEPKGTGEVRMLALPDPAEVERLGALSRIYYLLGLPPVRTDLEFLRLVESGLPVGSVTAVASNLETANLGAGVIAGLVAPRRTLERRRKENQRLTRDESDRLVRVARVVALANDVFASMEKAASWLRTPRPGLAGESPLSAVATDIGARLVEMMLHRIDHGITA
jgi:putative toxin-antitoxin system antitoxin component (TIGR02293 family)